jgi:phospholipid/cholesterol/gamma-HCH transport system permease protein
MASNTALRISVNWPRYFPCPDFLTSRQDGTAPAAVVQRTYLHSEACNISDSTGKPAAAIVEQRASTAVVVVSGDWDLHAAPPQAAAITTALGDKPASLQFDCTKLGTWDSALPIYLMNLVQAAQTDGIDIDYAGLPEGAQRLVRLAFAVGEPEGASRGKASNGWLHGVGEACLNGYALAKELLRFVGELVLSLQHLVRGTAGFQRADVMVAIQEAGAEAFPIVSLISFLIGMIFAFVGVMQLEAFGAGIYTADLVAVAMVREMAPIMTGIMMAGRTGAGYAAHLGTMKVNEEIDALTTLGINPIDFLVLPRVIALVIMMPLLTLYGSLMGILGGMVVGLSMLDASLVQYAVQTEKAVGLNSLFGGLFKALVYGFLVAVAGCQQGMACGSSAMAVGQATTRAVVNGIVMIVISASVLTIIYINLEI